MTKYTIVEDNFEDMRKDCCASMASPGIPSGRKDRIVIACVMLDVPMAVEPVIHYEADRVHLIHYAKNHRETGGEMYKEFYDEAKNQIESRTRAEVIEHNASVYSYHTMMRTLLEILNYEAKRTDGFMDIYVNISSGSTEYSAAAMLICMQYKDLTAFTVRTKEYMLSNEDVNRLLYKDERPVGFSASVETPQAVVTFDPEKKDADLVACLGVLKDIKMTKKRDIRFEEIINELKVIGAWNYEPRKKNYKTEDIQNERMYLKRNYITPMLEKGWIVESPVVKGRWEVTKQGEAIIEIYRGLE